MPRVNKEKVLQNSIYNKITLKDWSDNKYRSISDLIEEIIDEVLPSEINENFNKFVDIKEVHYG